jgi:hypothetical protein
VDSLPPPLQPAKSSPAAHATAGRLRRISRRRPGSPPRPPSGPRR